MARVWRRKGWLASMMAVVLAAGPVFGADKGPFEPQIKRGREYLLRNLPGESRMGRVALGTLALLKTAPDGRPEPEVRVLVERVKRELSGVARDQHFVGQEGTYFQAVALMMLIAHSTIEHYPLITEISQGLVSQQHEQGSWGYPKQSQGDTSQTQYVILALWDAATAGVSIPLKTWDKCLDWQIKTQDRDGPGGGGGFIYHPSLTKDGKLANTNEESATMGVAGFGTMMICRNQIPKLKVAAGRAKHRTDIEMLIPVVEEADGDVNYQPVVTSEQAEAAITAAEGWVTRNFPINNPKAHGASPQRVYYYLYGLERAAALRQGEKFRGANWYEVGGRFLASKQDATGSWSGEWSGIPDTSFALLFLGRAMAEKLEIIKFTMLERGTLVGSRGVPTGDNTGANWLSRQRDRYRAAPTTSIDELIKTFDDPENLAISEKTSTIEQLTPQQLTELVQKLGGDLKKLRQYAYDSRPGAREAALTALSRTRDYRVVPILIDGLKDKQANVYRAARDGVQYISRNADAFGLPAEDKRNAVAVSEGIQKVKAWYDKLKVQVSPDQEFTPPDF